MWLYNAYQIHFPFLFIKEYERWKALGLVSLCLWLSGVFFKLFSSFLWECIKLFLPKVFPSNQKKDWKTTQKTKFTKRFPVFLTDSSKPNYSSVSFTTLASSPAVFPTFSSVCVKLLFFFLFLHNPHGNKDTMPCHLKNLSSERSPPSSIF